MTASIGEDEVTNNLKIIYRENYDPNDPLSAFDITWNNGTNSVPVNREFFQDAEKRKDGKLNDGGPVVTNVDCSLNGLIDGVTDTEFYWDNMNKLRDEVTTAEGLGEEIVTRVKRTCNYAYKTRWDVCDSVLNSYLDKGMSISNKKLYTRFSW